MAVQEVMTNKTTDGIGNAFVNGATVAVYAMDLKGNSDGCIINILVDIAGGTDYTSAGQLTSQQPLQLIILPSGASCTAQLLAAGTKTKVTIRLVS